MKFSTIFLAPLLATHYVSAHGFMKRISIQGKVFEGNNPGGPANPSVIRQVSSQDPNKGATNPALICGPNSGPAASVADANPGDAITFDWRTPSDGRWPHNIGPMLTYMASCGSVTCDKFNQANAQWFKIDQVGRKLNGVNGEWVQNDLMNGGVASARIPQNIAPGNYLIRHEIIALHLGTSVGGAEFYPACAQLRIGGNGNGVPTATELVRFPGAYSDNDPGILAPAIFDQKAPYTFPGPAVATLAAGPVSPSTPPSSSSPLLTSPVSSPTGTPQPLQPPPSPVKKPCKKKNLPASSSVADPVLTLLAANDPGNNPVRTLVAANDPGSNPTPTPTPTPGTGFPDYRPRRLGHIMRRMAFENSFH